MNHVFTVQGMTCSHCEKAVTRALLALDPQARIIIDRTQDKVSVESSLSHEALAAAMADEGYTVTA